MTYQVSYESERGTNVYFTNDNLRLVNFEGFGEMEADMHTQSTPFQDGRNVVGVNVTERPVYLEFFIEGADWEEVSGIKRTISRAFYPKDRGKLTVTTGGRTYTLSVRPESSPSFPAGNQNRGNKYQRVQVDLLSFDPYWRSIEATTEPLDAFVPLLTFPLTFPVVFGERGAEIVLENDGDVPAPVEITFSGPASQPVITNETTGEFIQINKDLLTGERLVINTEFGFNRKVELHKADGSVENAWGYIDIWDSTLFHLSRGENEITYDALSSSGEAAVTIKFTNLYIGV